MASNSYHLRNTLIGHKADVRCILTRNDTVVSGSRDCTAKIWKEKDASFSSSTSLLGNTSFVSALSYSPPSTDYPDGIIYTGSNDSSIRAYSWSTSKLLFTLKGHSQNVCALHCDDSGSLLSGSWDCTAKLWLHNKEALTLKGHDAAVWAVLIVHLPDGIGQKLVTASADKSIRLWSVKDGSVLRNIADAHTDCVRALANIPAEHQFLSCSNDASVRRWNFDGVKLAEYFAHTNYIYSVALLPSQQEFISCGEDRTLRVWNMHNGDCEQTIALPAQSLWCCVALENGDIAVGCSDATIRLFSRHPARKASADELTALKEELASTTINHELGDIEVDKLSGPESLSAPGQQEGQIMMIKEGASVSCYQWSMHDQQWSKVGDVVGARGKGRQKMLNGKEYDFVFDVDLEESLPPLKIGCNRTDDPWHVAQSFIYEHNLSQLFLDQIAKFLIANTGNAFESSQSGPFVGGGCDPFTGTGSDSNSSVPMEVQPPLRRPASSSNAYFPKRGYLHFEDVNVIGVSKKLNELNTMSTPNVPNILSTFSKAVETGSCPVELVHDLFQLLSQWPAANAFPILDLLRWSMLDHQAASVLLARRQDNAYFTQLTTLAVDGSTPTNQLLILKCFVNSFHVDSSTHRLLLEVFPALLKLLSDILSAAGQLTKNNQIAAASLLLNMAVLVRAERERPSSATLAGGLLQQIAQCVQSDRITWDVEAKFRLCVALGTLLTADDRILLPQVKATQVPARIAAWAEKADDSLKLMECAVLLLDLF